MLAAGLALAPPAQAQTQTQIWSATMTPAQSGNLSGYIGGSGGGSLTDTSFDFAETSYQIASLFIQQADPDAFFIVSTTPALSQAALADLTIIVDGTSLAFSASSGQSGSNGRSREWRNPGFTFTAGTDVSLSLKAITGRPTPTAFNVRPAGNTLRVTFNENLSNMFPPKSAFTLTAAGSPVTIGRIKLHTSRTLELTDLSPLIAQGQTVTLDYTDPSTGDDTNAIQDTGGTDAHSFSNVVFNQSAVTVPKPTAAAVPADGATVVLTFSETLLAFQPAYSSAIRNAFTVTVDGTESQTTDFAVSGATATLTMSDTIGGGQTVIVSYDRSAAGREALRTGSVTLVANFTTGENSVPAVVNNAEADRSPPELTGATVTSSGDAIELAFGEDLDLPATIPAALKDAFSVTADGDTVEISGLAADGSSGLQINLSSKIAKDQAVVVSYDRSAAGTNALDDADGNEVASLTTGEDGVPAVDNNSAVAQATITEVAVTSTPRAATDTYGEGETIEVTVTFSEAVTATTGTDFVLSVAGAKRAPLVRGSGTATLVFGYTVLAADTDDNGIWIGDQSRTLVGNRNGDPQNGTITSVPTGTAADLTHSQRGEQSGHKVNGSLTPPLPACTLNTGDLWCGTLTVGTGTAPVGTFYGYGAISGWGSLSPTSFMYNGFTNTVGALQYLAGAGGDLRFAYSGNLGGGSFVLHVGSQSFSFMGGETAHEWLDHGLSWSVGDTVDVRLREADAPDLTAPTAPAFGATAIDLAWTAPDNDGGSAITGYKIEVSTDGSTGSWTDLEDDTESTNTDYRHSGLSSGDTRHYRVSAINAEGTSPASAPDSATTGTAAHHAVPAPIHGTVLWSAEMTVGTLGTLSGYRSSKDGAPFGALTPTTFDPGAGTPVTVDGLYHQLSVTAIAFFLDTSLGTGFFNLHLGPVTFEIDDPMSKIVALNGVNNPGWSHGDMVDVRLVRATAPGTPTGLTATASGTQIDLAWTAPASDGGRAVTGYRIEVSEDGSAASWSDRVADTDSADTSYSHTGLAVGDTRHYRVSAINAAGTSEPSDSDDATVTGTQSSDATLSGLTVTGGGSDLVTFVSGTTTYTAMVASTVTEVTVTATKNDTGATIDYLDGDDATLDDADTGVNGHQVTLAEGENVIKVKVTAADGTTTQTYTVTVKRPAAGSDATLSALVVNDGNRNLTLRPGFAPGTTSYRVWVVNAVAEVTVMATPNHDDATIEYLDGDDATLTDADTSDPGHQVAVAEGDTVVKVKVTAKDGNTTRTYTVTVTRRAMDAPGVEGDLRLTDEESYTHPDGHEGVEGRAEIFHAGRWGTVSSDGFSRDMTSRFIVDLDADGNATGTFTETEHANEAPALFCDAMGYGTGEYASGYGQPGESQPSGPGITIHYPVGSTYPPDGPLPIWLDDLTCAAGDADLTGESALPAPLAHCGYAGWGLHNSNHSEDAGVSCWNVEDSAMGGARALKARFVSPPEHHDGSGRVKVRVAFSEAIEESPENVGEHGVQVEGGRVTSVRQVDNQPGGGAAGRSAGRSSGGQEDEQEDGQEDGERVWEFEIEPGSDDDLTMRIDGGRPCDEPGAICTADGRSLSEGIATTVEGPDPVPLTAAFEGLPEAHDGEDTFHFRVAFSEDIGIGFRTMRDESFTVDGGEVTKARRVDRRHDLWQITVAPDGEGEVTVTLAAGRACADSGAICTRGGDRRQLTNTPTATVAGPVDEAAPAVLTASFVEAPHEHDGETAFTLRIAFSEGIAIGFRTFRDQSVSVSGGSVTHAKRVDRRRDLWKVTVKPGSRGDVTVTLAGGRACGTAGAVCTGDGRALSATISTTVLGPAALTVADARAKEGTDETIDFTVSLSRATRAAVTVAYATADGTATAGSDYTATSGTLTFAAGETEQTVSVPVLDDAHDEGEETLTLRLSAATGAVIADGEATGTIKNTDPLQRAWLARFGRTAATHVTDAVGERLRDGSGASHVTVGGYRLPLGQRGATGTAEPGGATTEPETTTDRLASLLTGLAGVLGLGAGQAGGPGADPGGGGPGWDAWPDAGRDPRLGQSHSVNLDLRRLLLGSSFRLSLGAAATGSAGPRLTAWGRVAGTTFDGRDGNVSLEGDVLTGTVGVDGAWDRLLAGLAVAHSRGDGSFTKPGTADRGRGELETTLTSIHPYLRYAVNDRLDMWGVLGYGRGQMEMEVATGETMETDMALVMGTFGGRGILLPAGETGGFELATRTDAMLTRTSSDAVAGMVSADAEAHRLRLVLEGSRGFAWAEGRRLTPTMEVGLRHDWGDAETGFGLELGGRVHYADPALGLTIEAAVRGLLAHEDDDYQEWGASGSLRLAPGAGGRGLALTLAPTWGAASSGVNGLWSRQTTAGLAPQGNRQTPAGQLNAEVGYGVAAPFGTGLLTPYAGTVLSDGAARTYRVGGRLQMRGGWATGLALNLEGTRQDPAGQQPVNQGLRLQLTWGF